MNQFMLSIGEFSNICRVSTKTLRYYAEIGLLLPSEVNPENGYRYYAIEQLEIMLFINRLKAYHFLLDEIGDILKSDSSEEQLYAALSQKKQELERQVQNTQDTVLRINTDMKTLMQGKSIMSFIEDMDVTLVDIPMMYLLSVRKNVLKNDYETEYMKCFGQLFRRIANEKLTLAAPPMVLFHGSEHTPQGLDTEFAAEYLFAPLKIDTLPNIFFHSKEEQMAWNKEKYVDGWVVDPMGVNTAGWGLALSVSEMLKIGLLYLNHGAWENKQIVSAEWITESTKEHSRWEARKLSYGYLWWLGNDGGYAAMGDGGNRLPTR